MHEQDYQYALELSRRQSGMLLGRVPIRVDWVPIQEALTLDLVRRSAHADFGETPTFRFNPQWRDSAADVFIRGVHATAVLGDGCASSHFIPIEYFGPQAQVAAKRFLQTGELQPGDLFEYRVLALKPPQTPAAAHRFSMEPVAMPVPLAPAVLANFTDRAVLFAAGAGDDIPVFMHWQVLEEVSVLTRQAGAMEVGGILVGHVRRDPAVPELLLEVTAQIPARARSELTRLGFSPDTWSDVQKAITERGQHLLWLGWWHSHSFFKKPDSKVQDTREIDDGAADKRAPLPFLSQEDRLLHRTVFPRAYSLALLITDAPQSGMSWTMFGWRAGTIVPRDFSVIDIPLPKTFRPLREISYATT